MSPPPHIGLVRLSSEGAVSKQLHGELKGEHFQAPSPPPGASVGSSCICIPAFFPQLVPCHGGNQELSKGRTAGAGQHRSFLGVGDGGERRNLHSSYAIEGSELEGKGNS